MHVQVCTLSLAPPWNSASKLAMLSCTKVTLDLQNCESGLTSFLYKLPSLQFDFISNKEWTKDRKRVRIFQKSKCQNFCLVSKTTAVRIPIKRREFDK